MTKLLFKWVVGAMMLSALTAGAEPLKVKWYLRGGQEWDGFLFGTQGENFVLLKRPVDANPVGVGINTIIELVFDLDLNDEELGKMFAARDYEGIIIKLEKVIAPFDKYDDIPSNLTKYNAMLMESYYRTRQFEKTIHVAKKVAKDSRDPLLQARSQVYQPLAMIEAGKAAEAEALIASFGWNKNLTDDSPPQQLYIVAKLLQLKKQYSEAMLCVARVIAFHSADAMWMQLSEVLCAEIYVELGLYDSAEEVCKQIDTLYKGSEEYDQAQLLKRKIERLRAGREIR